MVVTAVAATPQRRSVSVSHVSPDHFRTSQQADYVKPDVALYQRNGSKSKPSLDRAPQHVSADHFKTSQQTDFVAFERASYVSQLPPKPILGAQQKKTERDPDQFVTMKQRDFKAPMPSHSVERSARRRDPFSRSLDDRNFGTEYNGSYVEKEADRSALLNRPAAVKRSVTHVDPSHFITSKAAAFVAPTREAIVSAFAHRSPSSARVTDHRPVDASHFVSTSRMAFTAAPAPISIRTSAAAASSVTPRKAAVTHVGADHFVSTSRAVFAPPPPPQHQQQKQPPQYQRLQQASASVKSVAEYKATTSAVRTTQSTAVTSRTTTSITTHVVSQSNTSNHFVSSSRQAYADPRAGAGSTKI